MYRLQVLLLALCLPFSASSAHAADAALCEITAKGERVDGPCRFTPRRNGSFDIAMEDKRPMGGATSLSLDIVSPGVGQVRGLTPFGVRSRWGQARRMDEDRACWRGADFTICVRTPGEAAPVAKTSAEVFAGRCHMDICTWIRQPPAQQIGSGSTAVPGRRVQTRISVAQTEHQGGAYPAAVPDWLAWSKPQSAQFFCSPARPAFRNGDGSWLVLPLPDVFGATESITRQYLHACHPGSETDNPYEMPRDLGYSAGIPQQDSYSDFEALIRG